MQGEYESYLSLNAISGTHGNPLEGFDLESSTFYYGGLTEFPHVPECLHGSQVIAVTLDHQDTQS
jgi:hypothetical protein